MSVYDVAHPERPAGNEIYLYEVLATDLLRAMLVRRAEQSRRQSSSSALPTHALSSYTVEKSTWLDDHVAKQRAEAHVEVDSFHNLCEHLVI